jgi:hypothetical protein
MKEMLFDIAWWVPVIVVALGIAVTMAGNNRQQAAMRNGGVAVAVLGILWLVASFLVETPTKLCQKQTKVLVQAMTDGDWSTFERLTDPKITFNYVSRPWRANGRAEVEAGAKDTVQHIHSASAGHLAATRTDDKITIAFVGYMDTDLTPGHPIDSDWEFDWKPTGDQWRLAEMRVLRVDETSPEGIRQSLNKH